MVTTIQISEELRKELASRKINDKEKYENIIWDLIEDSLELSEETKRNIEESRIQIKKGEVFSLKEVKKSLSLNV
ncbi:hypothetical protein COU53_01395 [Candidatus Pacearchaeota archaeon CG10_big_fil_rev_8_21_14_0_10_30_48]|nr:MAG: hypothetical protein COU53_01395 [Candidatus Pacearchaeota archaeon CG10_big_fil_rev_8_21_14_0_10_30_48]